MKRKSLCRIPAVLILAGLSFLSILMGGIRGSALAAGPTLFFSDLQNGPNTGWSGPTDNTTGAAVTIWGVNLGSSGTISIGGQTLSSSNSSQVAEWGTSGTANGIARGMQRITFWLNSSMATGPTTISVTTGGVTSNTLPFTIRALGNNHIYFVSVNSGSDSNNGSLSAPWKDIYKSNPNNNSSVKAGDVIYIEGGTYTALDGNSAFLNLYGGLTGTATDPYAWAAYPGQVPILNIANGGLNAVNKVPSEYVVFSKLEFTGPGATTAIELFGEYWWVTGCWFTNINGGGAAGVVDDSGGAGVNNNMYIYGNYFYECGYSGGGGYMHNIYLNSNWGPELSYAYIGWNEFSNEYQGSGNGGIIDIRTACLQSGGGCCCTSMSNHIYIHDNYFHDSPDEALYLTNEVGAADYYFIYNNVMANLTGEAAVNFCNWDNTDVFYNNTLYQAAGSSFAVLYFGTTSTVNSMNNIYYLNSGQPFINFNGSPAGAFNSTNDLYYNTSVPSGPYISVTGAVSGNPLFVSTSSNPPNFHLQSGSPAINAGTSAVGSIVTTDYNGSPRPPFSIGAYNYSGEIPSAPIGLSVQ